MAIKLLAADWYGAMLLFFSRGPDFLFFLSHHHGISMEGAFSKSDRVGGWFRSGIHSPDR
ncbi:MAG TPA: hypothetical protein VMT91_06575 [Anaerolineales bacterium]|nr:hypothetical protein [Anaerolineales bacterium]